VKPLDPRLTRYARAARRYIAATALTGVLIAGLVVALKGGDTLAPEGPGTPAPLGERVSFADLPGRVREAVAPRVGREERA